MANPANNQPALQLLRPCPLDGELLEFAIDRQARNLTPKTLKWYQQSLDAFRAFCVAEGVTCLADVTASHLRRFLVHLQERGHNPGGVKNIYGAVKALLNWYAEEDAPDGWRNPTRKVKTPRVPEQPLEPVNLADLQAMLATCERRTFYGERDRALLLFLLDTGVRHAELWALNVGDVDMNTGSVLVRSGKGRKPRVTFAGPKTRQALARYLRHRENLGDAAPLWATRNGGRLSYQGIREVLRRRAERAGMSEPSLHSFRRGFAIASLRAGMDLVSLQRLLGHSDLSVIRRYLAQTEADLRAAHEQAGPVDNLL